MSCLTKVSATLEDGDRLNPGDDVYSLVPSLQINRRTYFVAELEKNGRLNKIFYCDVLAAEVVCKRTHAINLCLFEELIKVCEQLENVDNSSLRLYTLSFTNCDT